ALIRRSYCYRRLSRKAFLSVLRYLSSRNPDVSVYAKIWLDEEEGRFGRKRGSRLIYFTNVGTIPEEGNYRVITHQGVTIGTLSEKFVEQLSRHDVFVLGGRTYGFERVRGMKVFVRDASGRRPTVPSWTGEMLPRSFDLSLHVGRLRQEVLRRVDGEGEAAAMVWLQETCRVDLGSARSLVNYLLEQRAMVPQLPTDETVVLEGYIDTRGNRSIVFHYCFGRRTNDALARAYAFAISNALGCNARISVTDDNFMVTIPKRADLEEITGLLKSEDLEDLLRRALRNTELFKQRFRHCATRSFMILRNYRGHQVSVGRQQLRSQRVLDWLHELEDFPVIQESYNEILNDVMDLRHAREVLEGIEEGRIQVHTTSWSNVPSPLAHNVVLAGISDIVLMEDRSAMLRDLHRKVLRRVVPEGQLEEVQFTEDQVQTYFRQKAPRVAARNDILSLFEKTGALNLLQQKGRNVYDLAEADPETVRLWCEELVAGGEVASVWTPKGVLWVGATDVPAYAAVYARPRRPRTLDRRLLAHLEEGAKTAKALGQELELPRVQVNDALRRLERGYRLNRRGLAEPTYEPREIEPDRFEEALDRLVTRLLGFQGPMTLEELAFELDLKGEMLREALNGLVNEATLASGHFVVDEAYQYMVAQDLRRLEAREQALPTFEETAVRSYLLAKSFQRLDSVDAYFDRFLEAGVLFDIFQRVEGFDMEEWYRRREAGDILEGRFLHGRVRYVLREEAPLFASAYRRPPLGPLEERVLAEVAQEDGLDLDQVTEAVGADRGRVKEALHALDRGLHVIRKFTGSDAWTTKNIYVAYEPDEVPDAQETIVRRFLRAYGPVSPAGVKGYTGFGYAEAEGIVERLLERGVATKILVQGDGDVEMLILTEELSALRTVPESAPSDALRILSLQDPWVQPMWAEVNSRYGDGWYYPVVKDGKLAGMVEMWQMSGCLEVREIELADPGLLPELLNAVQQMMDFYGQRGYEIVRVVGAFGKSVLDAGVSEAFEEAGFHRTNDFFAWGKMVPQQHSWEEVLSYVFYRQGIHPDRRFKDAFAAVEALGGLRSDFASILRTRRFTPLKELFERGLVVKGLAIPPYATFCTEEDLELYRAAKAVPMEEDMEEVWELIREGEPISKGRLVALAPFPEAVTERALRKLYRASCVIRSPRHRYRSVGEVGLDPSEAKKAVLRKVFEAYGIFSAENLGAYTRGHFRMGEIRRILRELEREGVLVKGFLIEGEAAVYWMLNDGLLGQVAYKGKFVLSPWDNLSFYLRDYLHERWRMGSCYAAFDGSRSVAAFKARKRGDRLMITEYQGDSSAEELLRAFAYQNDLTLQAEGEEVDEWELIRWYEKMYGGIRD
ncbi:MAG: crosslink repair DNA glycosylase YcaQ family protein, partial [Thermoplasmata archaeon]